jgi:hypothetical protein
VPVRTDPPAADILAGGCGKATAAQIEALGMSQEFLRFPDSWDRTPFRRLDDLVTLTRAEAQELGLAPRIPELPDGLTVSRLLAQAPVRTVHYFLTNGPVTDTDTYVGVLEQGGAIMAVEPAQPGRNEAARRMRAAEEAGLADRKGIINVGGHDAIIGRGDQQGTIRKNTIIWSDERFVYSLDTAFEDTVDVVDLARAIACAQD